jgi:hypothetical protein
MDSATKQVQQVFQVPSTPPEEDEISAWEHFQTEPTLATLLESLKKCKKLSPISKRLLKEPAERQEAFAAKITAIDQLDSQVCARSSPRNARTSSRAWGA